MSGLYYKGYTTLSLAASGASSQLRVKGGTAIQIVVDTGDAQGTFYLRTAAQTGLTCVRHATLYAEKTAATTLNAKLDYSETCGEVIDVEWVRTSGGSGQTATIYVYSE